MRIPLLMREGGGVEREEGGGGGGEGRGEQGGWPLYLAILNNYHL